MAICLICAFILLCCSNSAKAACNPCPQGAVSCPTTASVEAGHWESHSRYCDDANYELVLTSIEVGQEDGDGDDFTVTVMDEDDYNKFQNSDKYSYYTEKGISTGGVGAGSYTCFQYSGQITFQPGTNVVVVIKCVNLYETCHLRVKTEGNCVNPDSCAGVDCGNGHCSGGSCICDGGYSGNNCENYDPCYGVGCSVNGNCVDGNCICLNGYWGSSCSHSCSNEICQNGVECIPSIGCQSARGYSPQDVSHIGSEESSHFPTTIVIICSCVGFVLVLSVAIVSALLCRRARRRRVEASYTSSITPNGEPNVVLVSAMEQQ